MAWLVVLLHLYHVNLIDVTMMIMMMMMMMVVFSCPWDVVAQQKVTADDISRLSLTLWHQRECLHLQQ